MKKENIFMIIWRCVYPLLIHVVVTFGIGMTYTFLLVFYMAFQSGGTGDMNQIVEQVMEKYTNNTLYMLAAASAITIPIYILLHRADQKNAQEKKEMERCVGSWCLLAVIAVAICISLNALIGYSGIEKFSPGYQQVAENLYSGGIVLELLVVGILVPICEEYIFRGLMFQRLCSYTKTIVAILISALAFAVYHGNIVQGIYAFCLGVMMAACCWRFRTILAPILVHVIANITSVCITEIGFLSRILENEVVLGVCTIATTLIWIGGILVLFKKNIRK